MTQDSLPTPTPTPHTVTEMTEMTERSISQLDVGELPRATPKDSGGGAFTSNLDAFDDPFDGSRHERRWTLGGKWMKKRGNGARKSAGKSYSVPKSPVSDASSMPPTAAGEGIPTQFASGSRIGAIPGDAEHIPEVETAPTLNESDYEATGRAVTRGLFGLAQLTLDGKAWEPTPEEAKAFGGAFTRIWHHYSLPRLGPVLELLFLVPPAIAKRADQPRTARLLSWFGSFFRRSRTTATREPTEPERAIEQPEPVRRGGVDNPRPVSRFRFGG